MIIKNKNEIEMDFKQYLTIKDDRIITQSPQYDQKIVIPSRLFPLNGEGDIRIFTAHNTELLNDNKIAEIFDSVEFNLGRCFENIDDLFNRLTEGNISDIVIYVGWKYIPIHIVPVHHCILVYKDNYVLDFTSDSEHIAIMNEMKKHENVQPDIRRKVYADIKINRHKLKHSIRTCFGYIEKDCLFIGRPCNPSIGRETNKELRMCYPNHIAFRDIQNGTNKTQMAIKQKLDSSR